MDKYYDRVRERVSDLYVQYSKTRQDYSVRLILIEEKLKETSIITYEQYMSLSAEKEHILERIKELTIRIDCMDIVREICLNTSDELYDKRKEN